MALSPNNSKMAELKNITESPEYKNNKYSDSKTNTISQKNHKEDEVAEYNIYDSPRVEVSSKEVKRRGLVINASGNKKLVKLFNNTGQNIGFKYNQIERHFNNEIHTERSHHNPPDIRRGRFMELNMEDKQEIFLRSN